MDQTSDHDQLPQPPDESAAEPDDDGAEHATVLVRKDLTNRRLDQYLPTRFPRFSRSAIQKLIDAGAVTVNGQPAKVSRKLSPGDVIDLVLPPPQPKELLPEPIPLDIIWQDEHLLAVNKQAGLIVHPARGNPHGTLVNGLVYYADKLAAGSDPFRPGIIHRLDRDTTGLILIAKTDEALWRMSRQFEARRIHKEYLAIVHGQMELSADVVDAPLARHRHVRERFAVDADNPQAKPAATTWRVLERFMGFTLLQLEPKTGRTHQLRVHMSYLRHPIVGDVDYGGKRVTVGELQATSPGPGPMTGRLARSPEEPLIRRQALHAHRLRFRHPVSGQPMELAAPPPADFAALLDALRQFRSG